MRKFIILKDDQTLQTSDDEKKERLTPYSILYKGNQVKISIQVISTKKNFLNDVIMTLTWPEYNLQIRYKMISQVLQVPQLSNFVRIVGVTRHS